MFHLRLSTACILTLVICLASSGCSARTSHQQSATAFADGTIQEMQNQPVPTTFQVFSSTPLSSSTTGAQHTVYVTVRDPKSMAGKLKDRIQIRLQALGITTTEEPSRADRIIDIEVISRKPASAASAKEAVMRGYGTNPQLQEGGDGALIADVLLVRRLVPTQTSAGTMKNSASRNATGVTKLRIGVCYPLASSQTHAPEQALAAEIAAISTSDASLQPTHATAAQRHTKKKK